MRKLQVVLLLTVSCSVPILGQDKGELFGGYSFERIAPGCGSNYRCGYGPSENINGWTASATGYLNKSFGVSAQFTGGYNGNASLSYSKVNRYTYQFGPTYAFHVRNVRPFAHFLLGAVSQKSSGDQTLSYGAFIWSAGGGLDWKASNRISLRPVQFDYERQNVPGSAAGGGSSASANGLRYSAGVVFHF